MDTTPRNERERIGSKGWKQRNRKLIDLGQVDHHRSIRYGEAVNHPVEQAPSP